MISTKRLVCPFCDVRLRVADTLPAGKKIKCPKCGEGFPIPDGEAPAPTAATVSSSYRLPTEEAPKRKVARKATRPADDGLDEETEKRPKLRKRRKKAKEPASNGPLVWGLVIGGAVAVSAGVILLM